MADVYGILNAARVAGGYEDRIPEINQENLANLSLLPPTQLNDFIDVIAKVVKQYVYDTTFDSSDNPFAAFYQEKLPYGASVEDLYARTKILDKRESKTKNDRGIVYVETIGYNQKGEDVISFRRNILVKKQNTL